MGEAVNCNCPWSPPLSSRCISTVRLAPRAFPPCPPPARASIAVSSPRRSRSHPLPDAPAPWAASPRRALSPRSWDMAASGGGSAAGFVVPGLPPPRAPRGARGGAVRCCRAPPPSAAAAAASRASAVAGAVLLGAAVGLLAVTPAGAAQLGDGQTIFEKSCAAYVVWAPPHLVLVSLVLVSVEWLLSRSWPRAARCLPSSLVSFVWACSLTGCPRFGTVFLVWRVAHLLLLPRQVPRRGRQHHWLLPWQDAKDGGVEQVWLRHTRRDCRPGAVWKSAFCAFVWPCCSSHPAAVRGPVCLASFCVSAVFLTRTISFSLLWRCSVCSFACPFLVAAGVCGPVATEQGVMPGYDANQLSDSDVSAVSQFVIDAAGRGWK